MTGRGESKSSETTQPCATLLSCWPRLVSYGHTEPGEPNALVIQFLSAKARATPGLKGPGVGLINGCPSSILD